MKKTITKFLLCTFLASSIIIPTSASALTFPSPPKPVEAPPINAHFSDIHGHWAEPMILDMASKGVISGFPDGTFRPDDVVTADQFLVMMLKSFSKRYVQADGSIKTDFDKDWMMQLADDMPGMLGSLQNGMSKGYFHFQGASTGTWSQPFIDIAYDMGYLLSFDPVFSKTNGNWSGYLTREKVSYLLGLWHFEYEGGFDPGYIDLALSQNPVKDLGAFTIEASSMYKADVLLAGLMRGSPDHYFYPQRYVTRAEAASMLQRLSNKNERTPFMPDLTGKYYTNVNGRITMIDEKYKYDTYQAFLAMAKKDLTTGYVNQGTVGIGIYKSQLDAKSNDRLMKTGQYDKVEPAEMSGYIDTSSNIVGFTYRLDHDMPDSQLLLNDYISYLIGSTNVQPLKDKLTFYENNMDLLAGGKAQSFSINGKKLEVYGGGKIMNVRYYYNQ